jgi:hypothetical protein
MLRSFQYLNTTALNDYVSALEDGLRQSRQTSTGSNRGANASIGAGPISVGASGGRDQDSTVESTDTSPARFGRLLRLAEAAPEQSGWVDLATLDDLSTTGYGALVDFECELHVPEIAALFGQVDQVRELGALMNSLRSFGPLLGEDMSDLPAAEEIDGITNVLDGMKVQPVVVGEDDESEWRVVGVLAGEHLRVPMSDLDGYFRVTAKIGKPIKRNEHKLLLNLPGMSLMSRDERRAMEKKGPTGEGDQDMFIEGPARVLDVLAIYR